MKRRHPWRLRTSWPGLRPGRQLERRQGEASSPSAAAPPGRSLRRWTLLYFLLICGVITVAGQGRLPVRAVIERWPWSDKLGHFLLIGFLAYLINLSLAEVFPGRLWAVNLCLLGLVVGEELSQIWLAYRAFEMADLAADLLGMTFFVPMAHWQLARRRRKRPPDLCGPTIVDDRVE